MSSGSNRVAEVIPSPGRGRWRAVLLGILFAGAGGSALWSDEPPKADPSAADKEREARLVEMHERLDRVAVRLTKNGSAMDLKRRDKPLMRFNDPARTFVDGGIWAYGDKGRPHLLVTLERYEKTWAWELISLSTEAVSAQFPDGWNWSPQAPRFRLKVLPDSGDPAGTEAARLRQMRSLVRRISASETTGTGERFELRLMPQPILRYSGTETHSIDGGLFAFAYGTNPELVVALEAHPGEAGTPQWHVGFVPMTTAAASASIDGKEAWSKPLSSKPKAHEPYTYLADPVPGK